MVSVDARRRRVTRDGGTAREDDDDDDAGRRKKIWEKLSRSTMASRGRRVGVL